MTHFAHKSLLGSGRAELASLVESIGEPPYRAQQLLDAIYRKRVESIERISTLPQPLRGKLAEEGYSISLPSIEKRFVSKDGTVRYLIAFADRQSVETVWMPEGDGGDRRRHRGRRFRAKWSPRMGSRYDLYFEPGGMCRGLPVLPDGFARREEKSDRWGNRWPGIKGALGSKCFSAQDRVNLVFMGMGEPFLNYDNFIKAVRLLVEEVGVPESRMTVSTAGIVPRIHDLGLEPIRPKLAISLNASNDEAAIVADADQPEVDLRQLNRSGA